MSCSALTRRRAASAKAARRRQSTSSLRTAWAKAGASLGGDEKAGYAMRDDLADTARGACHHRYPARLRLQQRQAEGFVESGPDAQIGRGQPPCNFRGTDFPCPGHPAFERIESLLDSAPRRPVTNHLQ